MITVAIAPVRDQPRHTAAWLDCMREQQQELDAVLVLDNGSGPETLEVEAARMELDDRLDVMQLPSLSIYELWNEGADYAEAAGVAAHDPEVNLLVSNNDVLLPPGAAAVMAEALRARPELWCIYPDDRYPWGTPPSPRGVRLGTGVARTGGLYGPCFMVALDRLTWRPLVSDLAYEWWYGDDHLARQIEESGGTHGRLIGMPVLHAHEGTAQHHPETLVMRMRDRKRWIASERNRGGSSATRRRMVPGTKVWAPGGARIDAPPEND